MREDAISVPSAIIILLIAIVGIIGMVYAIMQMEDYYAQINELDPGGVVSSGVYNGTRNLTYTVLDIGTNYIWLLVIPILILVFLIVYAYTRR
jgi:uncharacterized integral membrane protein